MTPLAQYFTPLEAAVEIVTRHGVVDAWLDGARVADPTAGDGSFLEALVAAASRRGVPAQRLPLAKLIGVERDPALDAEVRHRLRSRYGVELPSTSWRRADLFELEAPLEADVLVGNPPWANFVDLPDDEREHLRPWFEAEGMVGDRRSLLLGRSRVDVAALFIAHALRVHLRPRGKAHFLAPLSLVLNDGAHEAFRRQLTVARHALRAVWDLRGLPVFEGVRTRYGLLSFERDADTRWPVPWHERDAAGWQVAEAMPADGAYGALRVGGARLEHDPSRAPTFERPRQGVNACGATDVFVFDRACFDGDVAMVENARVGEVRLPRRFVHPLLTARSFAGDGTTNERFVLLPHDRQTGRPLSRDAVEAEPLLASYLNEHEARLRARRGAMLARHLRADRPWTLLGVGPYCYAPYRVAWEAYGRSTFRPRLFDAEVHGLVQGNQAMHAFIPCASRAEAERCLEALSPERIEPLLRAHRMEGTRSWAQPGRMARILGIARRRRAVEGSGCARWLAYEP